MAISPVLTKKGGRCAALVAKSYEPSQNRASGGVGGKKIPPSRDRMTTCFLVLYSFQNSQ